MEQKIWRCGTGIITNPISGERKIKDALYYPHLPLCRRDSGPVYKPKKPIRSYTEYDLKNFQRRAQERVEEKLRDFRSSYGLEKSASTTAINQRVRKFKTTEERSAKTFNKVRVEVRTKRNEMPMYDVEYDPDLDKRAEWSLRKLKKTMRGKSAEAIKGILLHDAEDNILKGAEFQTMDIGHFQEHLQSTKALRASKKVMIETTLSGDVEESVFEPLVKLRSDIRNFSMKQSSYMESKR